MKICYVSKQFNAEHSAIIEQANAICMEYYDQGLVLTLRQLYYQFIARDILPNTQQSYNRLGTIITDARRAGKLDWDFIIDRTRNEMSIPHYKHPGEILERAQKTYHTDLWKGQGVRPIVFVEKDAAVGIIEGVCNRNDVAYLSCRGYASDSELWSAAQRIRFHIENGDRVVVLHIGDHDPSGLDMTRDINDRLARFLWRDWLLTQGAVLSGTRPTIGEIKAHMRGYMVEQGGTITDGQSPFTVKRIALNHDQVLRYQPPPNYAKTTDSRFKKYYDETGLTDSWELDALEPNVLISLVQAEIDALRDDEKYEASVSIMECDRLLLSKMTKHYQKVAKFLNELEAENE